MYLLLFGLNSVNWSFFRCHMFDLTAKKERKKLDDTNQERWWKYCLSKESKAPQWSHANGSPVANATYILCVKQNKHIDLLQQITSSAIRASSNRNTFTSAFSCFARDFAIEQKEREKSINYNLEAIKNE